MNKFIAYCGLDCEKCEARIATINDDNELRMIVAKKWSEWNKVEITKEMINCVGCRIDGVHTPFCESLCVIKKCAINNNFNICGECKDLSNCEKIKMIISNNDEVLKNLIKK